MDTHFLVNLCDPPGSEGSYGNSPRTKEMRFLARAAYGAQPTTVLVALTNTSTPPQRKLFPAIEPSHQSPRI